MQESTLTKIAIITSLVGILMLFFVTDFVDLDSANIDQLDDDAFGDTVKISGLVTKATNREKVIFLEVAQPDTIDVVLFKDHDVDIPNGSYVEVEGTLEEYNNEQEIIANKITLR